VDGSEISRYVREVRTIQQRDGNSTLTVSHIRLPRQSEATAGGNDLSVSLEGAGGIGGLLARSSGYSSGNWTSHADYYSDGNGNVTSLIDGNQSVVASYRYDPFGNIISKSGTLANANVYRFSSKEVHLASGMYYYGFRFYDPSLQRWVNRDPVNEAGGINLYGFLRNSPLNAVDPVGLCEPNGIPLLGNIVQSVIDEVEKIATLAMTHSVPPAQPSVADILQGNFGPKFDCPLLYIGTKPNLLRQKHFGGQEVQGLASY
jgi:RHS repeat-associated protein